MKFILIVGAAAALAACSSMPGAGAHWGDGYGAHHRAGMASTDAACNDRMKLMQDMRQKMLGARTPEERAALMKDPMMTMPGGMGMMGQMKPGGAMPDGMMACRMDMMDMKMQLMMQMMLDRDIAKPPATK